MVENLTKTQTRILTWVIIALTTFLTIIIGWQQVELSDLPKEYVRLERYTSDQSKVQCSLDRLDRMLEKNFDKLDKKIDTLIIRSSEINRRVMSHGNK